MSKNYKSSVNRRYITDDDGVCVGFARVVGERPLALLVSLGVERPEWIPKSQLHDRNEIWEKGQEGDLWVRSWIASEKGWLP